MDTVIVRVAQAIHDSTYEGFRNENHPWGNDACKHEWEYGGSCYGYHLAMAQAAVDAMQQ